MMEGGMTQGNIFFIPLELPACISDPPSTEARGHILSAYSRTTEQLVTSLSMCQDNNNTIQL